MDVIVKNVLFYPLLCKPPGRRKVEQQMVFELYRVFFEQENRNENRRNKRGAGNSWRYQRGDPRLIHYRKIKGHVEGSPPIVSHLN